MKEIRWIGSTKSDVSEMPLFVKTSFGHRLWDVQLGLMPEDTKPLPQFGRGVYELRESYAANAYRFVYVANLKKAVYVLHVFMKKSTSGVGLPKPDIERIKMRLKKAQLLDAEE